MLTFLTILFVVSLLIFINGLYVAGEFSAVSARKTRIIQAAEEGSRLARTLLPVLQDRHKLDSYIAASQVGITLSSIVLGIYGEQQIAPLIAPWIARLPLGGSAEAGTHVAAAGIASTTVLIVLTTLQVVMGELVPKSIALQYPERTALTTALPMKWSADYFLKPLIMLLNGSGRLLLKLLGTPEGGGHTHLHSPEEILILAEESQRGGLIPADEHRFLQNVFRSGDLRAVDVAVPRTRIVAAEASRPVHDVIALAADSAYTRIPIYEGDIDQIVGIVHLRDLFALYRTDPDAGIDAIVRPVPFVPETLTTTDVWQRLDEAQSYVAIVFDEYGGTSGLITREDLVEELFGELQDEFDQEQALVTQVGAGRLSVRGDLLISVLNDRLDIDLPHEQSRTIGGLVMDTLGRIPEVGDEIEIDGVQLRVEAVDQRSASRVCVTIEPEKTA
ncbi:MAG: HlyC/CorC family transporter [Anaerolineae bacterium]|nr:HlyC/CorC family transporter [Anaerolineae bacterium]